MENFEKVYKDYEAIFNAQSEEDLFTIFENSQSDLVLHDVCYHLGRHPKLTEKGIKYLVDVARSDKEAVVRHEAVEALSFHEDRFLLKNLNPEEQIVKDTLTLCLVRDESNDDKLDVCPVVNSENWSLDLAVDKLLSGNIVEQYHAMSFLIKLHHKSPEDRVQIISAFDAALKLPENYLLKHEICFQLGVLGDSLAWQVLVALIERRELEHPVVVHEAIIALEPCSVEKTAESLAIVEELLDHPDAIVNESAYVAKMWLLDPDFK